MYNILIFIEVKIYANEIYQLNISNSLIKNSLRIFIIN